MLQKEVSNDQLTTNDVPVLFSLHTDLLSPHHFESLCWRDSTHSRLCAKCLQVRLGASPM